MLNNYDAKLKELARFLVDNAPQGATRETDRLLVSLQEGHELPDYFSFEFRPTDDVGAQLYVRVESPDGRYSGTRIEDAEGNLWRAYVVKCEVSWASWGADDVTTCQRRLAVMTEVTRFACEVERAFSETFYHLFQTKAERDARALEMIKNRAEAEIRRQVRVSSKGMKVGQTKSVVLDKSFDLTGVGEVIVENEVNGRVFKYSASVEHGRRVGETGLVYFMRLEV